LDANHLSKTAVSRVILVGGPTLTPLVRSAVESGLGIKPEFKVDPMTIVARGAALFAASQRTPQVQSPRPAKGTLRLKLAYSPVSQDTETDVAGKVEETVDLAHARVEISRADGGWNSGKLALTNNAFMASVVLNDRAVNEFQIKVFDTTGNTLKVDPENFTITHGPMVEDAPLSRAISLGLSDNTTHVLIRKGTTVPCQGRTRRGEIVTAHEVSKGEMKDVLNIPLLQGENERSDRNREIGTLRIPGKDISRTLPAGSDVEMVVEIDRDFKVKVNAFIPLLSQSFPIIFGDTIAPLPRVEDMQADFEGEKQRLVLLGEHQDSTSGSRGQVGEVGTTVKELEEQLNKARMKDPDAAERVRRGIEELKARIDLIEESQKWPLLLNHFEEVKQRTTEAVQGSSERKDIERLDRILGDAKSAVESRDHKKLEKVVSSLESMTWEIWARQDDFWVISFQNVSKYASTFIDRQRGSSLVEEGALAIERADFASLRSIVKELWALVPDSQETTKEKMQFPSSLRKRTVGYL
jgi:molecular chaperone DnaK